jgi:hypothetical protein
MDYPTLSSEEIAQGGKELYQQRLHGLVDRAIVMGFKLSSKICQLKPIAQLIQKKATQRQWRQIFQAIASFSEWLYIPVAIGLLRFGRSIRVKRISVPDD